MVSLIVQNKFALGILLFTIFCFQSFAYDKIVMLADAETYKKLLEVAQACSKETGIPAAALKQILDWPMDDTRASKEFFQCVCHRTGYTDKDGHFVIDTFLDLHLKNGTKEEAAKVLNDCNKVTLADPIETAFAMGDCAHKYCIFGVLKKDD